MLIGLRSIRKLFNDCETILQEYKSSPVLTGYIHLENAPSPYTDYQLYICNDISQLQHIAPVENMHFIFFANDEDDLKDLTKYVPSLTNVLFVKTSNINDALLTLQNYFYIKNSSGLFADSLMDMLYKENGIQSIVNYASSIFENTILVYDSDFRLIASNINENQMYDFERKIFQHQGFTKEEFDIINERHTHKLVVNADIPVDMPKEEFGINQMGCAIDPQKNVGHITLSETKRPFREADRQLLIMLRDAINQQMKKDEFIRNSKGFPYEFFLRDILEGKGRMDSQSLQKLGISNNMFPHNMYCMVVEPSRSENALHTNHIRLLIENTFPTAKTLMYQGQIVALLSTAYAKPMSTEQYDQINRLCIEEGIYAGVSIYFNDIRHLANHYRQAIRAIDLGIDVKCEPGLYRYRDYYMDHVKRIFCDKESPDTFCHPALKHLLEYDKENDTEYAKVLYTYLRNERNMAATAADLGIHRNSLQNRLKKIDPMSYINYESYEDRMYIMLSYELLRDKK